MNTIYLLEGASIIHIECDGRPTIVRKHRIILNLIFPFVLSATELILPSHRLMPSLSTVVASAAVATTISYAFSHTNQYVHFHTVESRTESCGRGRVRGGVASTKTTLTLTNGRVANCQHLFVFCGRLFNAQLS